MIQADKVIEALSELPRYTRVLSGSATANLLFLPGKLANQLCVLEIGIKRAVVLYAHDKRHDLRHHLAQAYATLLTHEYDAPDDALPCNPEVLEHLMELAELQRDALEADPDAFSQSQAKEIFESWVDSAVKENATDIHVRISNNTAEVMLRVDGELEPLRDAQSGIYTPLQAERAMAWAYNNASGKGSNSESQFSASENLYCMIEPREILGKRVALRYQTVRGWSGTKLICRLLYVDIDSPTLSYEQLGYSASQVEALRAAANTPSGMVLFAGVTGSGKTTTLKTFIETHPDLGRDAFYSLEDPVEYPLKGVHQVPIQRDLLDKNASNAKFGEVVAALMRADPGCVMMGEIRDSATAMSAQQIVETGHMACGTVHAHLISGIIPRLTNEEVGMNREVLTNPNMLTLLVYQALVPKVCPHCRINGSIYPQSFDDAPRVSELLRTLEKTYKLGRERFFFKNPKGCQRCRGRGTLGLTVVAELYMPDQHWLALIRESRDLEAMRYYRSHSDGRFDSEDMTGKTVFEHTLYKALQGAVDPRNCERFDSFVRFAMNNLQPKQAAT